MVALHTVTEPMHTVKIESVGLLMFLSIMDAFYGTISLHKMCQIFILYCIFLSAIIQNVNVPGPQQNQEEVLNKDHNKQLSEQVCEQEPCQGQCQELC